MSSYLAAVCVHVELLVSAFSHKTVPVRFWVSRVVLRVVGRWDDDVGDGTGLGGDMVFIKSG